METQITEYSSLDDIKSSREARAKRLKSLRKMTRLSRNTFSHRYGIPTGTLQNWESARFGGLTEKGAKSILSAMQAEGVHCRFEWLMHGIGPSPQLTDKLFENDSVIITDQKVDTRIDAQLGNITQELLLFRKLNPNTIDFVVHDDGMEPLFTQGDHIAGCRRHQEDITTAVGQNCIVQTINGEVLLRHLRAGSTLGLYTLLCINTFTRLEHPVLYDVKLRSAAPVIWIRRKDF